MLKMKTFIQLTCVRSGKLSAFLHWFDQYFVLNLKYQIISTLFLYFSESDTEEEAMTTFKYELVENADQESING